MRRIWGPPRPVRPTLAVAVIAAIAPLAFAAPAQADNPYATGDLSTLDACTWNYWRVVSIGEGLAHQLGDVTAERDRLGVRVDRQAQRIAALRERVARLRGKR